MEAAHLSGSSEAPSVLRVSGVHKTYGSILTAGNVKALDDVTFEVFKGEICGLVGPNGAGKSTLIKVIMSVENRDAGSIEISKEDGIIGYMPEKPIFFDDISAYHNLLFFARLANINEAEEACRRSLKEFGLEGRENDYVSSYSKGMRQRLAMARAVLHGPGVLIMDEPFSGLDPSMMIELREIFKRLKDKGMTMLLSSHELNEIDQVCTSILFIDRGRIMRKESLEEEDTLTIQIVLASPNAEAERILDQWRIGPISKDGRSFTVLARRDGIPDIVFAVASAKGRIEEVKVLHRKAEDRYADIFLKGGI
jgi:ABC-2 type transport system ATP-binding protein